MFAGVNVFHHDCPAGAANPCHFAQHFQRPQKMMQRKPAYNHIERPIFERQILCIGSAKRNIGNTAFLRALLADRQHSVRQIDANHLSRRARERFCNVTGPGRDIQHALAAGKPSRCDQTPNALLIGNPWIRCKSLGLCRKRLPNNVVMLYHLKSLAQRP